MSKIAPNLTGGFDIAVLTHENIGEALLVKVSPFSETAKNERLFLISKQAPTKPIPLIDKEIENGSKKVKRTTNRKRIIFDDTFLHNGITYNVNSAKSRLYVETLQRTIEQFEIAIHKWRRVFVLRFDLHMATLTKNSGLVTAFRKRLFQKLKRVYGFKEIGFCWVREQERSKAQHYHWVLFLDGDLIRHSSKINLMIKDAWEIREGDFHVPVINRPFYFADSLEIAQKVIYRVSYLAKPRGKGYRHAQAKDFQCSRMKLVTNLM